MNKFQVMMIAFYTKCVMMCDFQNLPFGIFQDLRWTNPHKLRSTYIVINASYGSGNKGTIFNIARNPYKVSLKSLYKDIRKRIHSLRITNSICPGTRKR
jgi:hypothetical protein